MHRHLQFCFDLIYFSLLCLMLGEKSESVSHGIISPSCATQILSATCISPFFLAEKHPAKGKIPGENGGLGLCCLVGSRTEPALGRAVMWWAVLCGRPGPAHPWGPLGGDVPSPLGPIPSLSLRVMDVEQSDANPVGAARATGKKGQACSSSRHQPPPPPQPWHWWLQEHSNPEEAQAGRKPEPSCSLAAAAPCASHLCAGTPACKYSCKCV